MAVSIFIVKDECDNLDGFSIKGNHVDSAFITQDGNKFYTKCPNCTYKCRVEVVKK